ncbi:MAG TPA: hypothetical protein VEI97_05095 [bacterium]|nr:hypothetical protein [bacterium]
MARQPDELPTDLSQLSPDELERLQVDLEGRELERLVGAERWWWGLIWATVVVCVVGGILLQIRGCNAPPKPPEMGGKHYSVPIDD